MNKQKIEEVVSIVGSVARKIAESAVHAAIFAYVSKKVTNLMNKKEEENKEKIRIEENTNTNVG